MNSFLGLPDSSSDEEDTKPHEVKIEEEVFVDISPQKAIDEEITYQRIKGNYTTEDQLKERKKVLLKFLEGAEEYLKQKGPKDVFAARSFIEFQVASLFHGDLFSVEEEHFLERMADSVVRIIHRIQCRKYVLNRSLEAPSSLVDLYFCTARSKANKERHDRIIRENDRMLAARVRENLFARFTKNVRINEEPVSKKSNIEEEDPESEDESYMADVEALIGSMEKQNIGGARHCEYSENTEFDEICEDLLRQFVRTRINDEGEEEECEIMASPPRSPVESRSGSPVQEEEEEENRYEENQYEENRYEENTENRKIDKRGILKKRTKYGNIIEKERKTSKTTRIQFCDPRENQIKLFTRASEEEILIDHIWLRNIERRRMMNDNGTTVWHETYDGKTGCNYLSTPTSRRGRSRSQASARSAQSCVIQGGKEMLPTTFCLSRERTYPVVQNAIAELELPTYVGLQPKLCYYQTKNMNAFNDYFINDVFSRLCNFHYDLLGFKSIREYEMKEKKQYFHYNAQPQYNKLMLTDSVFGQCNPMTLLNTCLLVCNPNVDHRMFVNSVFEFIRKLLFTDLSAKRQLDLSTELQESLSYLENDYTNTDFYKKTVDFDVSGGIFLCFGHDILVHNEELRKKKTNNGKNEEIREKMERIKGSRVNYDVQLEAIAETVVLTNKVIYELKELWTLMDWWSWRPFPDIWLITLPEGRNGDFIKAYNVLLRDVLASKEMFPVTVKLIDWTEVLENANEKKEHDKYAVDEDSVEDRFKYLFRLMRQTADVRYRRSQEERIWEAEQPRNYKNNKEYRDKIE